MDDFEKALKETEAPEKLERSMSTRSSTRFRERSLSTTSGSTRGSMRKKVNRSMSVTSQLSDSWSIKDEVGASRNIKL